MPWESNGFVRVSLKKKSLEHSRVSNKIYHFKREFLLEVSQPAIAAHGVSVSVEVDPFVLRRTISFGVRSSPR